MQMFTTQAHTQTQTHTRTHTHTHTHTHTRMFNKYTLKHCISWLVCNHYKAYH